MLVSLDHARPRAGFARLAPVSSNASDADKQFVVLLMDQVEDRVLGQV